eukprot:ctg_1424.g432
MDAAPGDRVQCRVDVANWRERCLRSPRQVLESIAAGVAHGSGTLSPLLTGSTGRCGALRGVSAAVGGDALLAFDAAGLGGVRRVPLWQVSHLLLHRRVLFRHPPAARQAVIAAGCALARLQHFVRLRPYRQAVPGPLVPGTARRGRGVRHAHRAAHLCGRARVGHERRGQRAGGVVVAAGHVSNHRVAPDPGRLTGGVLQRALALLCVATVGYAQPHTAAMAVAAAHRHRLRLRHLHQVDGAGHAGARRTALAERQSSAAGHSPPPPAVAVCVGGRHRAQPVQCLLLGAFPAAAAAWHRRRVHAAGL